MHSESDFVCLGVSQKNKYLHGKRQQQSAQRKKETQKRQAKEVVVDLLIECAKYFYGLVYR